MKLEPYKAKPFSAPALWGKLSRVTKRLGREMVEKILWLYYASLQPQTPAWAKTVVYTALAYFILPIDAIPDVIPGSGYSDDLAAITAALSTIAAYVDSDVKKLANEKIEKWFGVNED